MYILDPNLLLKVMNNELLRLSCLLLASFQSDHAWTLARVQGHPHAWWEKLFERKNT